MAFMVVTCKMPIQTRSLLLSEIYVSSTKYVGLITHLVGPILKLERPT